MPTYKNLPANRLELLDGNLIVDESITGPVVLIIGTAKKGPEGQILVRDSNTARALFGDGSPILSKLSEVKFGGAKNVVLYRIGGKAASVNNLFGTDTSITTVEASVDASSKYSVYIGPQPNNGALAALIVFEGTRIVYSNVTGAEVDLGRIVVEGFDPAFTLRVGYPTAPVVLSSVVSSLKVDTISNKTGNGATVAFTLPGATNPGTLIEKIKVNGTVVDPSTYNLVINVALPSPHDEVVFTAPPADTHTIEITFNRPGSVVGATFSAGEDNINCSLQKYYELLDKAYTDLETTIATEVFVDRITLDAPNLADGSSATDKLTYLNKGEDAYGEVIYEWSTVKTLYKDGAGTTPTLALADLDVNGQPIVAKTYHEVNFVHQLGEFAYSLTENERFVLCSVATSQPEAYTSAKVAKWIGSSPEIDIDGVVIANGSGLLGNKFMAGSITRAPGFYHTDSGFPDGNVVSDSQGAPIDLGKFLSVVAAVVSIPPISSAGLAAGSSNGAALYTGLTTTIIPGNSTTNELIPRVTLPFDIKKTRLDDLSYIGYVVFQEKKRGVVCASGELATNAASDYDYISTSIIIRNITNTLRERLDTYLGKGIDEIKLAAMQTAVDSVFQEAVKAGMIKKYAARVIPTGVFSVTINYTVVPVFELRDINNIVKLSYDI